MDKKLKQMREIEKEHDAKSEFQREVEKMGQPVEPVGDERIKRALKSIAARRTTLADLSERGIQTQAITATLDDCAELLRDLSAQSGQRAGVAESVREAAAKLCESQLYASLSPWRSYTEAELVRSIQNSAKNLAAMIRHMDVTNIAAAPTPAAQGDTDATAS